MSPRSRRWLVGLWLGLSAHAPASAAPPVPATPAPLEAELEACRQQIVEPSAADRAAAMCFYDAARRSGGWAEARRELEALVAAPGAAPMLRLALAAVEADMGELDGAVALTTEALASLTDQAPVGDRASALANLGAWQRALGRYDEARAAFTRLAALGRERGVLEIEIAAEIELGVIVIQQGGDLSRVRDAYDRLVSRALEHGSYSVGNKALVAQAQLATRQGRWASARQALETLRARARQEHDAYDEAYALVALADVDLALTDAREQGVPPSLRASLDAARGAAEAAGLPDSLAHLQCAEAQLSGTMGRSAEAATGYGRCAEAFAALGLERRALDARTWQALYMGVAGEPERSEALAAAGQRRARALGLREEVVWACYVRTVAASAMGDGERVLALAEACFAGVEQLRALQGDERDRSREIAESSVMHYFVAGSLLRDPTPARLDQAFQVVERLRARNLLDWLHQAEALPLDPDDPGERQWRAAADEIAALQRALVEPSLDDAARQRALAELDVLEAREARLRTALVGEPHGLVDPASRFPHLDEVQAALGPHEALLGYQLADVIDRHGSPEGGAWLWVITRASVQAIPLPERRTIVPRLSFVAGLLARRDGREQAALAGLHHDLLAPALAVLPPEVTHLLVVPDGELWSLPFAALPAAPGAGPLVDRYSLSLVPSVASWLRWGQDPPAPAPGLLALARPEGVLDGVTSPWREGTLATGLQLGALPRAGEEVEAITRLWGRGDSQAEVGDGASERFLKGADLSRYGLVHLATHAVMDPQHPERSAVVLAAGDVAEDGLLQTREIVRLPLRDKVVVLSACSGAAGQLVRGEGVMSLARAFLQGGARAVVASRWPLADADAVVLFERLYVHLDDGLSLAEALARAQRDLHEAGAPAAAWAGVVVLGRGDVVLVPRPSWWPHRRWLAALGALVALGIAARLALRGRAVPRSRPRA